MHRNLSRSASAALTTLKAIVLGYLLSLSIGLVPDAALPTGRATPDAVSVDASTSKAVHRVMRRHHCSTTGFGANAEPLTALIRTEQGRLRVVTFEEGWAVYTGNGPGALVAVCLDDAPPSRQD